MPRYELDYFDYDEIDEFKDADDNEEEFLTKVKVTRP